MISLLNGSWSRIGQLPALPFWFLSLLLLLCSCGGGGGGGSATQEPSYTISGKLADANGAGVPGVTVTISAASARPAGTVAKVLGETSTVTDGAGIYTFIVSDGMYTIASSDVSHGFDPLSVTVAGKAEAAPQVTVYPLFSISGKIGLIDGSGFSGATVTLYRATTAIYQVDNLYGASVTRGSAVQTAISASSGIYTINALRSGSYLLVPSKSGYVFNPDHSAVITITANGAAYVYDQEKTGNRVAGNVIYNSILTMTGNTVNWNFEASLPGGSGGGI